MSESPHEFLNPEGWKPAQGYANAVVSGPGTTIWLGGLVGWDEQQVWHSDDFIEQTDRILGAIVALLAEAGAGPEHLTRMTWFVVDKQEYMSRLRDLGAVYRKHLGRHYPAMALVQVVALVEDRARLEIQATAVVPDAGPAAGEGGR